MTARRTLLIDAVIAAIVLSVPHGARAAGPPVDPRPVAPDTPAFRAPAEPPRQATAPAELAPEPAGPLVLQDALVLALMRNAELAAFSWEARASEAHSLQAGKLPNPELELRLYRLDDDGQGGDADERRRLILSQVLELGGKRGRRVDLARSERDLAGLDYEAKRIEVATRVAARFAAVLGGQRQVDASRRYLEFVEQLRDQVAKLVEAGNLRSLEIQQIKRQVGLARMEHQSTEGQLAAARFALAATWDNLSPRFTEAVGDLERVKPVPDVETVIALSRRSPLMTRWGVELARSRAALALAKAGRVPDLTCGAGVRWEEDTDQQDYLMDLQIALPIFDRKQGEVLAARHDLARAQAEQRAAEAAAHEEITGFYYQLAESDTRRRALADEVLPAARTTFDVQRLGFERGADNLGDLLDSRRDLADAEVEYAGALVDYHQALADLETLLGQEL